VRSWSTRAVTLIAIMSCAGLPDHGGAASPAGTAFTYQGRLKSAGQPFNGSANLVFKLYDASSAGNLLGTQTLNGVGVNDGIDLVGQDAISIVGYQPFDTLVDANAGYARGRIQSVNGDINFFTEASFATGIPALKVVNSGVTQVKTLQILGGADLAEPFDVAGDDVRPGMVVVIDPDHPGRLKPCTQAYDRKAAGIVSGAGGVATGLSMGHEGTAASGRHPVALTGRVYCLADATDAPIEPGDMLTTSSHAGHAMKAADFDKARGAVLGKAMQPLKAGRGLVLVLVNLQ
jgi:hypothetical protein